MITEILHLIDNKQYIPAYELTKSQSDLPKIYLVWTQIMDGQTFDSIDRNIDFDIYDTELIETVNLYIHLSSSDWEDELLSEFRKVAKMIIAETSAQLMMSGDDINGELRVSIQQLINHFNEKELFESKADMSRVKAQLTLTMNLEKALIGQDMLQYGRNYEAVNQFGACIQIYSAIIRDFEGVLDDVENADVLELTYLKEAYEGLVRLTDDEEAKAKLEVIGELSK